MKYILLSLFLMISMLIGNSQMAFANTSEVLINGETPENYYKRFFYHTSGTCGIGSGLWFHFVESFDDSLRLPDAADGRDRKAELEIFIDPNGDYAANLSEEIFYEKRGDIETYRVVSVERFVGKWSITVDGKLMLEGLGLASSLIYNNAPSMDLKIDDAFSRPELRNQSVIIVSVIGTNGRDPYDQICGI